MYKVADIFCGCGGLSYGFSKHPSFEVVLANDWDEDILKTYKANHKNVRTLCSDISSIAVKDLKGLKIDVLLGGPPCQSFSTLGKRQMDSRANMFWQYLRILNILKPKIFIFENVKGLMSMPLPNQDSKDPKDSKVIKGTKPSKLIDFICSQFEKLGYHLQYQVLNAVDFGVPQKRERLILVGVLGSKGGKEFKYPKPVTTKHVSIKDALDDLPIIKSGENGNSKGYRFEPNNEFLKFVRDTNVLTEHISPKNNPKLIEIMKTLKDGEDKFSLPEHLRPKSGYSNTYAKMFWNEPAYTITRNFSTPSAARCIHPRDSRALTIREGARLQSFPDSYIFEGSDSSKRLQIGNAVPPLLSTALASAVFEYIETL